MNGNKRIQQMMLRVVIAFAGLTIAGVLLALSSRLASNTLDQYILVSLGAAIVGGALAFFLVQVFWLEWEKGKQPQEQAGAMTTETSSAGGR